MKTTCKWTYILRRSAATLATAVIVGVLGLRPTPGLAANPPELMSYKGYLTDATGTALVDGNRDIEFRIYDSLSGTTPLWGERQTVTTDGGVFSVFLGEGTQIAGGNLSAAFDGPERFIGITVVGEPELVPRMRFLSSPYSFLAKELAGGSLVSQGSGTLTVNTDNTRTTYSSSASTPLHSFVGDLETDASLDAVGGVSSSSHFSSPLLQLQTHEANTPGADPVWQDLTEAIRIDMSGASAGDNMWHIASDRWQNLVFADDNAQESDSPDGWEFAMRADGVFRASQNIWASHDLVADRDAIIAGHADIAGFVHIDGADTNGNSIFAKSSIWTDAMATANLLQVNANGWPNGQVGFPADHDHAIQINGRNALWNVHVNNFGALAFGGNNVSDGAGFERFAIQNAAGSSGIWVNGNIYLNGQVTTQSDRRIKKDIKAVDSGLLAKVCAIRPTRFHLRDESSDAPMHFGVIAQEVQEVFPEMVRLSNPTEETPNGTLSVAYDRIGVAAVGAIGELNEKTEQLNSELQVELGQLRDANRALLDQMAALTRRLEALESVNQ